MRASDLDRLMTASLDGEATPDESAALERALAGDPSLRQRYEAWQRLFAALDRVPAPHPPEGLVAAVMANIPAAGRPVADQLPSPSPVFGVGSNPFSLGGTMTDKTSGSFNKRKLVLGVGLAAIAVVVIGYSLDMPPGSKDTIGTILPAERFVKPQATAVDVPQGAPRPSGTPLVPPSADAAAATAEGKALGNTQGAALSQTRDSAEGKPQAQTMSQTRDAAEGKPQGKPLSQTRDAAEGKPQGNTLGATLGQTNGQAASTAHSQTAGQAKYSTQGGALGQTSGTAQSQTAGIAHSQTAGNAHSQTAGTAQSQTAGQAKISAQGTAQGTTQGSTQGKALGTTQ